MSNEKILVWTRPKLYWEEDKILLEARGISYLFFPSLSYCDLPGVFFPLASMKKKEAFVVFTSFFAAKVFSRTVPPEGRSLYSPFVMGQKSFDYLKEKGFGPILLKASKASELALALVEKLPKGAKIFLPGGRKRAFDMKGFFCSRGFEAVSIDCYETVEKMRNLHEEAFDSYDHEFFLKKEGLVLSFFSPSSVRSFLAEFTSEEVSFLKNKLQVLALGETTFDLCQRSFVHVFQARDVTRSSLIQTFLELEAT